jgi:TonB family protein
VSVAIHLLLVVALIGVRPPAKIYTVDKGEPLIVELPKADESAARGDAAAPQAPPTPAPKAAPVPKAQPPAPKAPPPAPPPRVARAEPQSPPKALERPAPEPPKASTPPPAPQEAPSPDGVRPAAAAKPPESQENEPQRAPEPQRPAEPQPRQAPPSSPAPQIAAVPPPRDQVIDGLSALRRRPGTPGAGGCGEGRAGIEGEPISLNSTDKRFTDYLIRVKRMIQDKWSYPCVKNAATGECQHRSAQLVVEFGILKDGQVPYVTVHQPAAWDVYDSAAVNAIKLAQPFPPVPQSLMAMAPAGSTGVPIVAHFHYVLESTSIMNFLR